MGIVDYVKKCREHKQSKPEIISIVEKVSKKTATIEDIEKLCNLLVYNSGWFKAKPEAVVISDRLDDNVGGEYHPSFNRLSINKNYISKVLLGQENIVSLFDVLGHEMQHAWQNTIMKNSKINKNNEAYYTGLLKDMHRNVMSEEEINYLVCTMGANGKSEYAQSIMNLDYEKRQSICKSISFANYYELEHERDARRLGLLFAQSLVDDLCCDKKCSKETKDFLNYFKDLYLKDKEKDFKSNRLQQLHNYNFVKENLFDKIDLDTINEIDFDQIVSKLTKLYIKDKSPEEINKTIEYELMLNKSAFVSACLSSDYYNKMIDKDLVEQKVFEVLMNQMPHSAYNRVSGVSQFIKEPTIELIDSLANQKRLKDLVELKKSSYNLSSDISFKMNLAINDLLYEIRDKYNENKEKYNNPSADRLKKLYNCLGGIYIEDFKCAIDYISRYLSEFDSDIKPFYDEMELSSLHNIEDLKNELDMISLFKQDEQYKLCDAKYGAVNRVDYNKNIKRYNQKLMDAYNNQKQQMEY